MKMIGLLPLSEFGNRVTANKMYLLYVGNHVVKVGLRMDGMGWVATFPRFFMGGENYVVLGITGCTHDGYRDDAGSHTFRCLIVENDPLGMNEK